jgi:hypothetical protein
LFATRKPAGRAHRKGCQVGQRQKLLQAGTTFATWNTGQRQCVTQIAPHCAAQQNGALKDQTYAPLNGAVASDGAVIWLDKPRNCAQEQAFSSAVWPNNSGYST